MNENEKKFFMKKYFSFSGSSNSYNSSANGSLHDGSETSEPLRSSDDTAGNNTESLGQSLRHSRTMEAANAETHTIREDNEDNAVTPRTSLSSGKQEASFSTKSNAGTTPVYVKIPTSQSAAVIGDPNNLYYLKSNMFINLNDINLNESLINEEGSTALLIQSASRPPRPGSSSTVASPRTVPIINIMDAPIYDEVIAHRNNETTSKDKIPHKTTADVRKINENKTVRQSQKSPSILPSSSSTTPLIQIDVEEASESSQQLRHNKLNETAAAATGSRKGSYGTRKKTKSLLEQQHSIELKPFRKKEVQIDLDSLKFSPNEEVKFGNCESSSSNAVIASPVTLYTPLTNGLPSPTGLGFGGGIGMGPMLADRSQSPRGGLAVSQHHQLPFVENSPRYISHLARIDATKLMMKNGNGSLNGGSTLGQIAAMQLSLESKYLSLKYRFDISTLLETFNF
jgi:hypothetical protein